MKEYSCLLKSKIVNREREIFFRSNFRKNLFQVRMNYFICSFYNIRIILYLEYECITFFFVEILLRLDIWIHNSYFLAKRVLKSHETKVRSRKGSPFPILRSDNHERGRGGRRVGGGERRSGFSYARRNSCSRKGVRPICTFPHLPSLPPRPHI